MAIKYGRTAQSVFYLQGLQMSCNSARFNVDFGGSTAESTQIQEFLYHLDNTQ